MSDDRSSESRFWLLNGDVPAGPYSVTQIHSLLASGEAKWQTQACAVGGGAWLPLLHTPGFGPLAEGGGSPEAGSEHVPLSQVMPPQPIASGSNRQNIEPDAATASPVTWADDFRRSSNRPVVDFRRSSNRPVVTPTPGKVPEAVDCTVPMATTPANATEETGVLVIVLGCMIIVGLLLGIAAAGYGIYEWVRPENASEICKKFADAKTLAETKRHATPRMYPVLDWLEANKSPDDPNDVFELTQEVDGPKPDTKLVGFRGSWFDQEAGKRLQIEGHFTMVRADGWKADDWFFTGVEGVSLPSPLSLVEYHRLNIAPATSTGAKPLLPVKNNSKRPLRLVRMPPLFDSSV